MRHDFQRQHCGTHALRQTNKKELERSNSDRARAVFLFSYVDLGRLFDVQRRGVDKDKTVGVFQESQVDC